MFIKICPGASMRQVNGEITLFWGDGGRGGGGDTVGRKEGGEGTTQTVANVMRAQCVCVCGGGGGGQGGARARACVCVCVCV